MRTPTAADAEAISALLGRCAEAYGSAPLPAEGVAAWFRLTWFGAEDVVLVEHGGAAVAYADATMRAGVLWLDLRVPPEGTGAIDAVLAWGESRARAHGARAVRPALPAGVGEQALRARGYEPIRFFFEMELPADAQPAAAAWPDGVAVRTLRPGEEEAVHDAVVEAFADHWEPDPRPFADWLANWQVWEYDPRLWVVADEGGEVAGVSLCSVRGEVGWVETLAVRRPWRRRGLGAALLLHSFRELRSRGLGRIGLEVDGENTTGAVRLYERVGMRVSYRQDCWERALG